MDNSVSSYFHSLSFEINTLAILVKTLYIQQVKQLKQSTYLLIKGSLTVEKQSYLQTFINQNIYL